MFLRLTKAGDPDPVYGEYVYVRRGSFKKIVRVAPLDGKPPYTFLGFGMTNTQGHEMGEAVREMPADLVALERFAEESWEGHLYGPETGHRESYTETLDLIIVEEAGIVGLAQKEET